MASLIRLKRLTVLHFTWTDSSIVLAWIKKPLAQLKTFAKGSQQLMADLPAARVTACRVFSQVGYPFRNSDLTTEAFLAALKRFVARRGQPIEIHSDNGRNFVGANNELRKILKALFKGKMEEIMDFLSKEQIKWNFNPPSAPHFGGLKEAGVKSLKYHLKRAIQFFLSHEEFLTLVVQIEAVLNSQPICPLSNDRMMLKLERLHIF
ncbi:integrase catalytic domain-containing protein [Trichonephila clavipes]|nr:integrase catalytic domain-containing protein [Trichonephila clavipes]